MYQELVQTSNSRRDKDPKLDLVIKTLALQPAQRELARIKTSLLDTMAKILESVDEMTVEDIRKASITASALTGNVNTKLKPQEEETGDSQQQEPHPLSTG